MRSESGMKQDGRIITLQDCRIAGLQKARLQDCRSQDLQDAGSLLSLYPGPRTLLFCNPTIPEFCNPAILQLCNLRITRMLIECIPNVSEGRRADVVDEMAAAIRATPGVRLLDYSSDPSHNRSVFTLAGDA